MMLERGPILIPLDGSELSEGALPYAVALAKALDADLLLVAVCEEPDATMLQGIPKMAEEISDRARAYHDAQLERARAAVEGVKSEKLLRAGMPGEEILAAAVEHKARAIVIATHGRSGIGRWVYGSVAGELLRETTAPIMAVGPHALRRGRTHVTFEHIMVPLDGSPLSEEALPVAKLLAQKTKAKVSLVRALQWAAQAYPYTLPDTYVPQLDKELEQAVKAYLIERQRAVEGVPNDAFVVRGAVADGLIDFEEGNGVDLAVMTTHARSGLARAALGSVADRLIQGGAPVLLLRGGA